MWNFDYSSVKSISGILSENNLVMTKKFGQNFLTSVPVLEKIANTASVVQGTKVWEIGPGIGALTSVLLSRGAIVTAFEIDHGFCRVLRDCAFADEKNFTLIEGDALKTWMRVWKENGTPDVVCANLPYNVGSVLIASFIEKRLDVKRMVYTLQSEVVRRICSSVGDSQYSGFSVLCGLDYECSEAMRIKAGCFFPVPNVDSSVVLMSRRQTKPVPENLCPEFLSFVRQIFSQRRKTVRNNLKNSIYTSQDIEGAFDTCGLEISCRAEELGVNTLYALFRTLEEKQHESQHA